ncbi:hypothetical protein HOLleu_16723 [Holothuria leucospilota]|uniref:Uncharacterized protein n=1 Tax=Holothuria leucospilota TaxID=206669 RepID=A0A9Q1HAT2_HOLLE|nr:hypothetical protein HOLleu_16723 [Holothuria leucospilota]
MSNSIWATYFHRLSTDAIPQHHLCPTGEDSWCKYQKALLKKESYKHKNSIPAVVMEAIKPVYTRLTSNELLSKCLDCITQNPNESLNNLIWKRCPKDTFVGAKKIRWGTADAVAIFNDGMSSRIQVLKDLGIKDTTLTEYSLIKSDKRRLSGALSKASEKGVKRRQSLRNLKKGFEDTHKEKEGDTYIPGGF